MEVSDPSLGAWRAGLNFYLCFRDGGFSRGTGLQNLLLSAPQSYAARHDFASSMAWKGRRFDPDQVHQFSQQLRQDNDPARFQEFPANKRLRPQVRRGARIITQRRRSGRTRR
jgi:hypothetical protein